jgi:sugar lactone lactonase YvrE
MKQKTLISLLIFLSACASRNNNDASPSNLPNVNNNLPSGSSYTRAKAEFDASVGGDGTASFQLVKKSYASGTCSHGTCIDYTDITVTNATQTTFALTQGGTLYTPTAGNNNLGTITTLTIGTLFDNDLFSCGGQKCTSAAINIYTTNVNGGAGLYNSVNGQSIPLTVTGPLVSTPTGVPYLQANELTLNSLPISSSQQVVSLANNFFSTDSYPLKADFSKAGAGTYKAHVVVEYDLIGPPPPTPIPTQTTISSAGGAGYGSMAESASGTIYDVGQTGSQVVMWTDTNNVVSAPLVLASAGTYTATFNDVVADSSGNIYVAAADATTFFSSVFRITGSTVTEIKLNTSGNAGDGNINGIWLSPSGTLYGCGPDQVTNLPGLVSITNPSTTATVSTKDLTTLNGNCFGITGDPSGNIYTILVTSGTPFLNVYSASSLNVLSQNLNIPNDGGSFNGMAYAAGSGLLYITGEDSNLNAAYWIVTNPASASPTISAPHELTSDAQFEAGRNIVIDSLGTIFIGGTSWNSTSSSNVPTLWTISGASTKEYPLATTNGSINGLAVDSSGNVHMTGFVGAANILWNIPSWGGL